MRKILYLGFLILSWEAYGQKYPVSEISADIRKGADAVIRFSEQIFEMNDISSATYKAKEVITVFNSDAFGYAVFSTTYDKLMKVKGIRINYYSADGKLIKKVRQGEIGDYNYTSSGSVYDDNRIKYYEPEEFDYPFTIEYEYEYDYRSMVGIPEFRPQNTDKLGVEKATYQAIVPGGYKLRYKLMNAAAEPMINRGSKDSYSWNIESLKPKETEYRGVPVEDMAPYVLIEPSEFIMEGYKGDMSSWSGFGEWQAKLNAGRDEISDEIKAKVDNLIAGVDDPREKARRIYEFMQGNTRYVSIQLGIGGLQPFDAMNVIKNGYGDCKALTNYMYSLLKYAGVTSNYVKIRAGRGEPDIVTDFASAQFNHVILAVPMERDTVWLECTSQTMPFNFLGDFTDDRHGLMITSDGKGALVKTPSYSPEESTQDRVVNLELDNEGNAQVVAKTVYKGLQYDWIFPLVDESTEEQRKFLLNSVDLPAFDLGAFSFTEDRSTEDPFVTETLNLDVRKYATKSGKRLFITPNLLNQLSLKPPKNDERDSPVIVKTAYVDRDTINIALPEGYRLEFQMESVKLDSEFGAYEVTFSFDPESSKLTYTRFLKISNGEFPAEKYKSYRDFIRKVSRTDRSKIVLIGAT